MYTHVVGMWEVMQVVLVFLPNFSRLLLSSLNALDRKLDILADLVDYCVCELLHNCIHIRMYYATVSVNDVVDTNGIIYSFMLLYYSSGFEFNIAWVLFS